MVKALIWEQYTIAELVTRTGFAETYLRRWAKPSTIPPEGFKRRVAAALGRSADELFGPPIHTSEPQEVQP